MRIKKVKRERQRGGCPDKINSLDEHQEREKMGQSAKGTFNTFVSPLMYLSNKYKVISSQF